MFNGPTPMSRHSALMEETHLGDRIQRKVRIYTEPVYYMNEAGEFNPINLTPTQVAGGKHGPMTVYNRNTFSLGVRNDGGSFKHFGMRPDVTQALNTESVEWTIDQVEYDGVQVPAAKWFLNVSNLGTGVRQMFKKIGNVRDFKITYTIHLKGFTVQNPKLTAPATLREAFPALTVHSIGRVTGEQFHQAVLGLQDNTVLVGFITNEHIFISCENRVGEFVNPLPNWVATSQESFPGSSMYVKNNIAVAAKSPMALDVLAPMFQLLTGATPQNGSIDSSNYLTNSPGKVAGWGTPVGSDGVFWLLMNTTDICPVARTLLVKKLFRNVGYCPVVYEDFVQALSQKIASRHCEAVAVDQTNYATDDVSGSFLLKSGSGAMYRVLPPCLLDWNGNVTSNDNRHTLKDNGDGTLQYVKYPSVKAVCRGLESVGSIDVTVYDAYSSGSDGYVSTSTNVSWSTVHGASSGDGSSAGGSTGEVFSESISATGGPV